MVPSFRTCMGCLRGILVDLILVEFGGKETLYALAQGEKETLKPKNFVPLAVRFSGKVLSIN